MDIFKYVIKLYKTMIEKIQNNFIIYFYNIFNLWVKESLQKDGTI